MTLLTRTLLTAAVITSMSTLATPSFDTLTIRATELDAPKLATSTEVTIDPTTGTRIDSQFYQSSVRGWEFNYSEQFSDRMYWSLGYQNDRATFAENSQMFQSSPLAVASYTQQTHLRTRRYTLGAGYIMPLSDNTTVDISGNIGRMKWKESESNRYDFADGYAESSSQQNRYRTVAGYQARLRHEFGEDLEFYATLGSERWYADEDETITVQKFGLNYFIFDETAISVEFGRYDDEDRSAIGIHFTY